MDKFKFKAVIFSILIIVGCSEKSNSPVDPRHYPVHLNALWEYNTKHFIAYYDSIGNLSDPEHIISENTIVQILNDTASLGNYNNLYHLKSMDINNPQYSSNFWYMDSDSGLFTIAYSSAGSSQQVLPKNQLNREYDEIKKIIERMNISYFPLNNLGATTDSIIFESTPRKVINYPLFSGSKWVERTEPFLIERNVIGKELIDVTAGKFDTWKIGRNSNEEFWNNVKFVDYVDLGTGLIYREILFDSLLLIIEPLDTAGFYSWRTMTELVRKE